jgi:predicted permease
VLFYTHIGLDLRFALRTWRRARGFAAVAVLTIALGIGGTTALYSVVNAVLLRSFGYADSGRLIQISGTNKQGQPTGVSAPDFQAIQRQARSFQQVGASRVQAFTLTGLREPVNVYGRQVTRECFPILGATPILGRVFSDDDFVSGAPPVAVLSFKLWQRDFAGDPGIAGRQLLIDGASYSVIGVMAREFQFPHPAFLIWTPWRLSPAEIANHRAHSYGLIARLRAGIAQQAAAAELQSISSALEREFPDTNTAWRATAEPINDQLLGKLRPAMLAMLGAVGFVLLIACVNVSNLLMARGLARTREMAIRSALGAPRMRLVAQLLSESLLIAALGGVLGMLFAWACLRALLAGATPIFPRMDQASLDGGVLLVALVMTVGAGVVFGLLPALELSRPDIDAALKESGRASTGSARHRRYLSALIVLESALSVVLLVGAGLMLRSFAAIVDVRPGFQAEHVLTAEIPSPWRPNAGNDRREAAQKTRYFHEIVQRLAALPGVSAAGLITGLPMGTVAVQTLIRLEGRATGPGEDLRVGYSSVSPDYFRTMGIQLLKGRPFSEADTEGQSMVAVINEAMARHFWPNEDAIGNRLTFNPRGPEGPWVTIVGITANVRNAGLTKEPDSQLYMSYRQSLLSPQSAAVVVRTALDPSALSNAVRAAIHQADSSQPVEVKTMTRIVANSVAQPRLYTVLLGIFGALALALAAAGIFSVVSWSVNRRTHEIGIRMALGATSRDVIGSIMGRALVEALLGAAAGLAAASALTSILKSQLYHVTATDPVTFLAAPAPLLVVAAIAAYIPARRASRVDPASALSSQ